MLAGANGSDNPNIDWLESRGFYFFYLLFLAIFHLLLLSVVSTPMAWTLTNISHNLVSFYFLHLIKGQPWITAISSDTKRETHFEQLDFGQYWTHQKKFLTVLPIVMFLLTCLYTQNSEAHFIANFLSLVLVTVPKLPSFYHVRLFNINKY